MLRTLAAVAVIAALAGADPRAPSTGEIRGSVVIETGDRTMPLSRLGPAVVLLEGIDAPLEGEPPAENLAIRQKDARFRPDFLAIAAGQTVEFPNDDEIFHNVFSYSGENAFDLGLYRDRTGKSVLFAHPGVVRIYCSIHESMNALVYVAPNPYFARVDESGAFRIDGVPPGRYRLRVWSDRLPERISEVSVAAGGRTEEVIRIGASPEGEAEGAPPRRGAVPAPGGARERTAEPVGSASGASGLVSPCCSGPGR